MNEVVVKRQKIARNIPKEHIMLLEEVIDLATGGAVKKVELREDMVIRGPTDMILGYLMYFKHEPIYVTECSHFKEGILKKADEIRSDAQEQMAEIEADPVSNDAINFMRNYITGSNILAGANSPKISTNRVVRFVDDRRYFYRCKGLGIGDIIMLRGVRDALAEHDFPDSYKDLEEVDDWSRLLLGRSVYLSAKDALKSWHEFLETGELDIQLYDDVVNIALRTADAKFLANFYHEAFKDQNIKKMLKVERGLYRIKYSREGTINEIFSGLVDIGDLSLCVDRKSEIDELFDRVENILRSKVVDGDVEGRLQELAISGYEFDKFQKRYEDKLKLAKEELWEKTWMKQSNDILKGSKNKVAAYDESLRVLKKYRPEFIFNEFVNLSGDFGYFDLLPVVENLDVGGLSELYSKAMDEFKGDIPEWCVLTKNELYLIGEEHFKTNEKNIQFYTDSLALSDVVEAIVKYESMNIGEVVRFK
jgi:hypothetical protein